MEQKFRIQFKGELGNGFSKEEAIKTLMSTYKKSENEIESWFSGTSITLKAEASVNEVAEFRTFFSSLGMELIIDPVSKKVEETIIDELTIDKDNTFESLISKEELQKLGLDESLEQLKNAIENSPHTFIFKPAKLGSRLIAYIIDCFIIAIISIFFYKFVLGALGIVDLDSFRAFVEITSQTVVSPEEQIRITNAFMLDYAPVGIVGFLAYFVIFEGLMKSNASLGKQLLNIKVYSLISPRVMLTQIISRTFIFMLAMTIGVQLFNMILPPVGNLLFLTTLLMARFDKNGLKRTLYDQISKTCVGYK